MPTYKKPAIPKYIRIYERVYSMIRNGELKVGDKIPTEPDLAKQFHASRMTVRKAIYPLVLEGLVERRPGLGTYVMSTGAIKLVYDPSKPIRFSDEMEASARPHSFELISKEVVIANQKIRKYLNMESERKVVCLTILLYAEQEPVIIERSYYPYEQFKDLMEMEISAAPAELLADKFNIHIKTVQQFISAVIAGKEEMKLFKVAYAIPCIYLEWISCQEDGSPFSLSFCYYRGDAYKFKIPTSELVRADTV
jgi:GntR family transcriptional regulator